MLTPLQKHLLGLRALIERGRDQLTVEEWRAFIWIACDVVGEEAAQLVVAEALEATEEAA